MLIYIQSESIMKIGQNWSCKMKVLIFEDKTKEGRLIRNSVETKINAYCLESERAGTLDEAILHLSRGDIGLAVVHHSDFSDVDEMRKISPDIKYAGYSGNLRIAKEFGDSEGSIGRGLIQKFSEHYDYILYNIGDDLDGVLESFGLNNFHVFFPGGPKFLREGYKRLGGTSAEILSDLQILIDIHGLDVEELMRERKLKDEIFVEGREEMLRKDTSPEMNKLNKLVIAERVHMRRIQEIIYPFYRRMRALGYSHEELTA